MTNDRLPRVHDRENDRRGVVVAASLTRISVVWDTGHDTTYLAADVARHVAADRWLFAIPGDAPGTA